MVYLFNLCYFDISNAVLLLCTILITSFVIINKRHNIINKIAPSGTAFLNVSCIFIIGVLMLTNLLNVSQKIYTVNAYNNKEYKTIEGKVEDFEYIYANNSTQVIGVKFCIEDNYFKINNGFLNVGYSIDDNIINRNGEVFKIYYLYTENDFIDTILRIDEI